MARKKPPEVEIEMPPMTPMIDVVFQLLLFFMIVVDMTTKNIEPIVVPIAESAEEIKEIDPRTVIVNVMDTGEVKIMGSTCSDDALKGVLDTARKKAPRDPANPHVSELPVMIRGDSRAPFKHIQKVMQFCGQLRIYRINLGAILPPK